MKMQVQCRELWCGPADVSQILGAVAVVKSASLSSDSTHSLGTSICHGYGPKKTKKKKKSNECKVSNIVFIKSDYAINLYYFSIIQHLPSYLWLVLYYRETWK